MLVMSQITGEDTAEVYNAVLDALEISNADRSTAICALLSCVATQINGHMPSTDTLTRFVNDASQWCSLYLIDGGKMQ